MIQHLFRNIVVFCAFLIVSLLLFAEDTTDERLANQYFRDGQYEQAVALYEELFAESPTPVIYNNYLESLFVLEEFRTARQVVEGQIDQYPDDIRYQVDLGWVYDHADQSRRSRRQLEGLIDDLSADPDAVLLLAMAFETRGYLGRAMETFQEGRRLLGESHPLHLRIAELHEKKGEYRDMMREYLNYMNEHPDDMDRVRGMIQDAIAHDPGFERNDALRAELLARTQRTPDNIIYSEMLLWLSIQQQDFRLAFRQARALDRRLQQEGKPVLEVADLSKNSGNYGVAAEAYQYLLDQGEEAPHYLEALVGYLNVRFLAVTDDYTYDLEDLIEIEREYKKAIDDLGIHARTVSLVRNLANLQAFYLGNTAEAIELLEATVDLPRISNRVKGECRIELADILLHTGEVWDATLLYSQVDRMFRDDPLAHEAKYKNARLTYFIGEFDWAKAQLDILKAGTSRLIANDAMRLSLRIQDNLGISGDPKPLLMFARAEQHLFMNHYDRALHTLDSIKEAFPDHQIQDDVLFARADIMRERGHYEAADSLLALITEEFPMGLLADEALFQRAELQQYLFERDDKAMSLYQQIMIDYPGSLHTITARNRFRQLRGDVVN